MENATGSLAVFYVEQVALNRHVSVVAFKLRRLSFSHSLVETSTDSEGVGLLLVFGRMKRHL